VLKLKSPQLTRTSFNRSNLYLEVKSKGGPWYDLSLLLAPGSCFVVVLKSSFFFSPDLSYLEGTNVMFCFGYKVEVLFEAGLQNLIYFGPDLKS